jgi:ABC-type taurine transport system ATPase subunit
LKGKVDELGDYVVTQEQVLKLLQGFADRLQAVVQEDVSQFVTDGVRAVFGKDKQFRLEFGLRANQVVANMDLDGLPLNDAAGVFSQSGGALNVVAYLLRLWVILRLSQQEGVDRVLLMDEPFGRLRGEDYKNRVAELLVGLSGQLGVQTIWVADESMPTAGSDLVYVVSNKDGQVVATPADTCCE